MTNEQDNLLNDDCLTIQTAIEAEMATNTDNDDTIDAKFKDSNYIHSNRRKRNKPIRYV